MAIVLMHVFTFMSHSHAALLQDLAEENQFHSASSSLETPAKKARLENSGPNIGHDE